MSAIYGVVGLVALQRLVELAIARRNTRRLMEQGATEAGARHYPLFVLLHMAWLASLVVTVRPETRPAWPALAGLGTLMALRLWVMASLGRYWTTRIITLADAPLVRRGPYRWVRHPNYMVVAGEIALLPLAFGAWEIAALFSGLNGALLAHRITVEDEVLSARGSSVASG